ncbi:MAG: outer membrane protein assembly factor BamD [Gemmatimonadota bacterium]|jgi:outer membrane protein assembly factor BamD|nr:hypothetical protein [Gemmatimonadota bacterium]MDP6528094.1 outer membrane protein assembly factor BamD [Gemmatimonadota bacterium]MDP6802288.1 outer membrane protein assembly factor BamD [Gemmatimonadota bacterium]MDP7031978.1 outer membrane protein assembly factor BamD [Gemmatimonadota bacterium]
MKTTWWTAAAFSVATAALLAGCAGSGPSMGSDPVVLVEYAEARIEAGKYLDAVDYLEHFARSYPGSALMPRVRMRLGDARFGLGQYILAEGEYSAVVQDFRASPFAEEAEFGIARSAFASILPYDLDQSITERAIVLLSDFRANHPESDYRAEVEESLAECRDRLARREYEAGLFYEKQRRLRSAKIQHEYILQHFPETVWAARACFRLGSIHGSRGELDLAASWYRKVAEMGPDTDEAAEALSILAGMHSEEAD